MEMDHLFSTTQALRCPKIDSNSASGKGVWLSLQFLNLQAFEGVLKSGRRSASIRADASTASFEPLPSEYLSGLTLKI